ncbi:hypothetical protein AAG570_008131 [Ranatra chinensis]|uniref:Uncharacterized protein n=1 Tax=Ranatra chinensis TaxID=642074 RepID=A0ABD0XU35_9HEMI
MHLCYYCRYTLQLLLHGDWPKLNQAVKTHLGVILHRCVGLLSKINAEVANKCCSLINLVHDPWKHPTLHKILHNLPTTEEEVNVFFEEEGSQLLVMRLEVLCESKCEDLALSLAESCFRYLRHSNVSQSSHVIYIRDVLLALLFRYKRNHDIITQLKLLDLQEGLNLVQRYAKRSNEGPRIWRNSDKVAEIAAHAILASAMVQCVEDPEKQQLLYDLIKEWVLIHIPKRSPTNQTIQNMIRKMIQTAESSLHIYIFCKVLINEVIICDN